MKNFCNVSPAANVFDRALEAAISEKENHKPVSLSAWATKHKGLTPAFSLRISLRSPVNALNNAGFFIAAVCKYGRDNQPNDASGSATRTCAGGDGVRMIEPARDRFSLFNQTFKPELENRASLSLPKRRMAPYGIIGRVSEPENIRLWDSFTFRSGITTGIMLDREIKMIEKEIEELSRLATLMPIRNTFKIQVKIVALKKELKILQEKSQ